VQIKEAYAFRPVRPAATSVLLASGSGYHGAMSPRSQQVQPGIGTLNEKPLHAALKDWYAQPGDRFEVPVDGYLVDVVRGDLLIEIQTRNFTTIRRKLRALLSDHPVRLVYPIPQDKWIVRVSEDGQTVIGRRKSPKHGSVEDVFVELVRLPHLLAHPDFSLEVLLTQEEEVRRHEPNRAWRRKGWVTVERRLLGVLDRRLFAAPSEMGALIPPDVEEPFTTSDLAEAVGRPRWFAQKMAYCLRNMEAIEPVGKSGNAILYSRSAA
jgi:hypothetical protein